MSSGCQTVDLTDQSPTVNIPREQWMELNKLAAEGLLLRNAEGPWRRMGGGNLRHHLEGVIEMESALERHANQPHGAPLSPRPAQSRARDRRQRGA